MSPAPGRCGLRGLLDRIHPVDKGLLVFMLVLLIQSAYSIFCPAGAGQAAEDIDIIVRTSAAAIFGYFLSANFIRHTAGQTPASLPPRKLETGKGLPTDPAAPMGRIGFSDGGQAAAPDTAGTADSTPDSSAGNDAANCLQVAVATCIGLFSLVTLLVLRNLSQWDLTAAESDSVAATVVQFRDFVSGCVGFLIGCPTHTDKQS